MHSAGYLSIGAIATLATAIGSYLHTRVLNMAKFLHCVRTACALCAHGVHTAQAKAEILTQEYLSYV